jgi:hypothetical protein
MDHSYLYSTRIQNTFDEDQAEIISIFKNELFKHPKFQITLINYYHGLPVSCPAQIISIEKDMIDLDVTPYQAFTMRNHHYTFIRSKVLKYDVYANVQYVNLNRRAASLRKLCYVEIMAERRNYIRLALEKPQSAMFTTSGGLAKGNLVEISINGACVQINHPCSLGLGDETSLTFVLNNTIDNVNYSLKTQAVLIGIDGDNLPRRYRFTTTPDKILDREIAKYLLQRQIEILQEIKDVTECEANNDGN